MAWQELVDWVIWLHDAYELSTEDRLPECWPQHPGLVRELAALRAWRLEIYTPPTDPATGKPLPAWGNGGSARAWHSELRNVVQAALTFYARSCRVGTNRPHTFWPATSRPARPGSAPNQHRCSPTAPPLQPMPRHRTGRSAVRPCGT